LALFARKAIPRPIEELY